MQYLKLMRLATNCNWSLGHLQGYLLFLEIGGGKLRSCELEVRYAINFQQKISESLLKARQYRLFRKNLRVNSWQNYPYS